MSTPADAPYKLKQRETIRPRLVWSSENGTAYRPRYCATPLTDLRLRHCEWRKDKSRFVKLPKPNERRSVR
jgi:hypothetical protein